MPPRIIAILDRLRQDIAAGLAKETIEVDDLLELDRADEPVVDFLAPPKLAAVRTRGFARGAVDGYRTRVGANGLHDLRAPVGLVMHPLARRP